MPVSLPHRYHAANLVDLSRVLAGALAPEASKLNGESIAHRIGLDWQRLCSARTVVLLVLDGAGTAAIEQHVPNGYLRRHRCGYIDSVFPSSTAPAITSLLSAQEPAAHGTSGWFVWSEQEQRVLRPLPMDWRDQPGVAVDDWVWRWRGWMSAAKVDTVAIQPFAICDSQYSRHAFRSARRVGYETLDELNERAREAVRSAGQGRRFVYAYAPDFDGTSHAYGWRSDQAAQCLHELDDKVRQLADALSDEDALLIVAADHGFCDIAAENQLELADFDGLSSLLRAPLSGEPRVAFCHTAAGQHEVFIDAARRQLGAFADVHRSADLLANAWFGADTGSPADCLPFGDVTLVMRDGMAIGERLDGERPHRMIGMHGGVSRLEMDVSVAMF